MKTSPRFHYWSDAFSVFRRTAWVAVVVLVILAPRETFGVSGTWNVAGDGNWNVNGNWTPNSGFPNANNQTATFDATVSGSTSATVSLNGTNIVLNQILALNSGTWVINNNQISLEGSTPTLRSSGTATLTINSTLAGTAGFTKLSGGTLILTGNNTGLSGAINLNAGTIRITNANALGSGALNISNPSSASTLEIQGGISVGNAITLNHSNTGVDRTVTLANLSGDNTLTNTFTVSGTAPIIRSDAGNLTFDGNIVGSATALSFTGAGTKTITGSANTYTGSTTVTGGTLVISGSGTINSSSGISVNGSGAVFRYDSSTALTQAVTFGASGGSFLYNSAAKYTGSSLSAGSDDTIGGNGVLGAVTIASGGTLTPGALGNGSAGTLTVDSLTLQAGATSRFDVVSAGSFDSISSAGAITMAGTLNLNFSSILADGSTLALFTGGSLAANFGSIVAAGAYTGSFAMDGGFFRLQQGGQVLTFDHFNGVLSVAAIPEPTTAGLLAGGLLTIALFRRRRMTC